MNDLRPNPSTHRRLTAVSLSSVFRTAVLVYLTQLLSACSFYSPTVSLAVLLPPAPEHWRAALPGLEFRIVYPTPWSGGFGERYVDSPTRVVVELPKVLYLPVLAYPILSGESIRLPPAGGVYPLDYDITDNSIALSWQMGATAEVLYRLWNQGVDCSTVNVPRLIREMTARCQGDPWALDLDRICAHLAAEELRLTDIRLAPCRDLRLEPGAGSWFLESPFRNQAPAETDGSLFLKAVSLGAHLLFENPAGACFFLYVEEDTTLMTRR
jgi:hypothetical protein